MTLQFGDCRLDLDGRTLVRGTVDQHLPPKAFEVLKVLVAARPRALSKAELFEHVWPGVFVSDASLARVVTQIRSAVGDCASKPTVIRTFHGYGYGFVADVAGETRASARTDRAMPGVCWLMLGRRRFPLADGEHLIGRQPDVGVWLDSSKVSRQHAKLTVSGQHATIEDLVSKNGTFVRGDRIDAPVQLRPGDTIEVGPFALVFRTVSEFRSTETAI